MLFDWFRRTPKRFDPAWEAILTQGVWQYQLLNASQQQRVRDVVAHMVTRKHWTGGSGFQISNTMRVTVSGVAALMTLGLDEPFYFPKLKTFILYPAGFQDPGRNSRVSIMDSPDPILGGAPRLGEAWQHGPVVLAWRTVERQARVRGRGRNLVLHEMAHHVDSYDGDMDGTPYFASRDDSRRWHAVADEEYHRLVGQARRREVTLLDHYGATNQAEFFAVATECFFERPHAMRTRHAELFQLLAKFYQQDPSQWMPAADSVAMNAPQAVEKPNRKPDPQPRRKQRTRRFPNLSHLQLGHVDELFSHGVLLMGREEYEDAATIFTEVLKHDPSDGEAHQHRGEARLAMGDFSGAVSDCEAALAADDGDLAALLIHAEASLHLGDDATAAKMVKRAFREDRENAEASLLQGKIAARAGDYRQAIQAFRAALSRDAFLADAHLWLADCLDNTNASEQAAIHRQRAYHLDPGLESDRPAF